jgi:glycosyltransferase involved in cell wall biosynthesis
MQQKTWLIIPAYNEENKIVDVINKSRKYIDNIIVVDDGSNDNTYNIVKEQDVVILRHLINLGKGAALKTGCDYAIKKGAEIMIVLDGDGQHNPKKIIDFINSLKEAEIVFGCRNLNKNMPLILKIGNLFINTVTRLLYGINLRDTQCGFRAFTSSAYKKIRWRALDYSMESEMVANVGKHHLKYKEIPIETIYSDKYKGTTIIDGIRIVLNLFLWRLRG